MKTKPSMPERKTIPVSCNKDCGAGCGLSAAGNLAESRWERNGPSGRSEHSNVDKANRTMYGISDALGTGGG